MSRFIKRLILLLTPALLASAACPCPAATAAEVSNALRKAIDHLYSTQSNSNWETVPSPNNPPEHDSVQGGQWGGLTGIATYALLAAEEDPKDPRIGRAVDFLQTADLHGVYAVSVRAQVWPFVARYRNVKPFARNDARLLMNSAQKKGIGRGQWFYFVDQPDDLRTDHSASQFALLGVWACEQAGVEIPTGFWSVEDSIWRRDQMDNGGWSYVYKDPGLWGNSFLTMTCAGLASLYITQEEMTTVASRCAAQPTDQCISLGISYVASHYPADFDNAPPNSWIVYTGKRQLYLLFGLSRLGLASGLRYFGENDWYKTGSDYLVKSQLPDGSWGDTWETALGVLFLARSSAPVAFNKLQYDPVGKPPLQTWNVRPRDVANLADWMGKSLERRINWQVVDIQTNPQDWLDAPVLYISGSDELKFSAEQIAKLRLFVESGGLILGNADCGSLKFTTSFKKLGRQLFPSYEFAALPVSHPIYTREQFNRSKWKSKPRLLGMSNGVRELMVICPDEDLGRTYAIQGDRSKPEDYQLGVNLCEYMQGLDLHRRGDGFVVIPDTTNHPTKTVRIARLKYTGNSDPEPGGWRRLAAILHNENSIEAAIDTVGLSSKLDGYDLADLTGTGAVKLDAAARTALREYVNNGGMLLVDAAGGNPEFAESMRQQLTTLFAQPLVAMSESAQIFQLPGAEPMKFIYSRFARSTLGSMNAPRLKSISVNGRPAVLFSAEDLALGLVGQPVDGVIGYAPQTAVEIVRRIVLSVSSSR